MTTAELTADLAYNAADILSAATVQSKTYEIVDVDARAGVLDNRAKIDEISALIQGGVHYLGKTTTELSDGATTNPIVIGDKEVTAKQGDMVSMAKSGSQDLEFIFNGTTWYEFGSTGSLKALAFKDSASVSYTPAGTVGISATTIGDVAVTGVTASFNEVSVEATVAINDYTPEGTISCGAYTPAGGVTVNQVTGVKGTVTVNEVSAASFTGDAKTLTADFTGSETTLTASMASGTVTGSATATLPTLPTLSASAPAVSVTENKTNVLATATVTNGVLSFGNTSVLSGASAALDAAPVVGYSSAYETALTASVTGTATGDSTVTYKPAGTIAVETYTPTGSVSVAKETKTPEVSVNAFQPTASFSGTAATLKADFKGTAKAPAGTVSTTKFTPALNTFSGKVTVPSHTHDATFSGTPTTITVS